MEVSEVMTGANGDTSIQFIELRMQAPGQNFVDGLTIVARNADGSVANTVFTFPAGRTQLVNAVTDGRILIATPAFAARAGILPDFTFAGGLFPVSGQVDYASGTATVAYGNYTGPGILGADAISAPGNDLRSLTRIANTGNDSPDFALQPNAPQNNSGQIGHISASYSVPLRITEVNPQTGQAEVTNVDVTTFTSASDYYFSFRSSNVSLITTGTVFAPGESKLYTLPGLDPADTDLWLCRDSNFSDPLSVLSGLKYGPTAGVGQVAVAVAGGIWPSTSAFVVATTQPAESLRLIAYDGTRPENWAGGTPNPGTFFGTGTVISNPIVSGIPRGTVSVEFQVLVSGLAAPLGIAEPDDGSNRIFVYDQAGTVTLLLNGVKQATPFLDVTSRLVPLGLFPPLNYDERGLLGFAIHPTSRPTRKCTPIRASRQLAPPISRQAARPPDSTTRTSWPNGPSTRGTRTSSIRRRDASSFATIIPSSTITVARCVSAPMACCMSPSATAEQVTTRARATILPAMPKTRSRSSARF